MTTTDLPRTRGDRAGTVQPDIRGVETRAFNPVVVWAALGAAFVALVAYMWTDWIVSGDARAVPGRQTIPHWMLVSDRIQEGIIIAVLLTTIYFFGMRSWRKSHRLSLDMMLIIAWLVTYMTQDPWQNYTRTILSYNAGFFNLGCPQCHAPGWLAPHGNNFGEPLIFMGLMYPGLLFLGTVLTCAVMRKAKARWARLGNLGLIAIGVSFCFLLDLALEVVALRLGDWVWWWATPKALTLSYGKYHQFPLGETLAWGCAWGSFACLRYFKNDKGQTFAERGIDRVKATARQKVWLRQLALIGAMNRLFLFVFNLPYAFYGTHAGTTPDSICGRGYFATGMAGPGTDQACPGPRIPLPLPGSARITPEGNLYAPNGLPIQLPEK